MSDERQKSVLRRWLGDESLGRIYRNAGVLLRGRLLAGLVSFAYLALAAHSLGPAALGVLVILNVYALTVGELVVFPGWPSIIRYGAAFLEQGREADLRRLLGFAALFELASGIAAVAVAAALIPLLGPALGVPEDVAGLAIWYALSALSIARTSAAAILYLFERYNTLSLQQAIGALVRLVGASIAYLTEAGLSGFLVAWLVANLAEAVSQWSFALKELHARGHLGGVLAWPRGILRSHPGLLRFSLTTKVDRSLTLVSNRVTPLSVGFMLEPAAMGLYHLALRLGMQLAQPALVLGRTVYPELATLVARDDQASVSRVTLQTGLITALAGLPFFLIFVAFGRPILEFIGGPGFGDGYTVLVLIAGSRIIHLFGFPLAPALTALGRPGAALRVNLLSTLVLFPVLLGLLQVLGLVAAGIWAVAFAIATVAGLGLALWLQRGPEESAADPPPQASSD